MLSMRQWIRLVQESTKIITMKERFIIMLDLSQGVLKLGKTVEKKNNYLRLPYRVKTSLCKIRKTRHPSTQQMHLFDISIPCIFSPTLLLLAFLNTIFGDIFS